MKSWTKQKLPVRPHTPHTSHTPHTLTGHIQANLDDELVQEALRQGVDMRQYSRQIESELRKVELKSIEDCIPPMCVYSYSTRTTITLVMVIQFQ